MQVQLPPIPCVMIMVNQAIACPENPQGIEVVSNMNAKRPDTDLMILGLINAGTQHVLEFMRDKALGKISKGIVMPDGSAAPILAEDKT